METVTLTKMISDLIKKYESNIIAATEQVEKYKQQGNEKQMYFHMGVEKAYQNVYRDLTGQNYNG